MLRINLLPTYVSQRRLTRKLIFGLVPVLVLSIAVPLFLWYQANQDKAHWLDEAQQAEAGKAITDKAKSDAAATRAQIAPLLAKVDYVKAVHQHNNDIVAFWNTVAEYSDPKVVYSDAAVSGTTLTIKAYTPSIAEIGRYLQAMYSEPDFVSVGIDRLPGYPEAVVSKYYLNNRLIATTQPSTSSGGGGASSFGGGGYPGGSGGPRASGGAPGGFGAGASSGPGGGAPGGFGGGGASTGSGPRAWGSPANPGATGANVPQISQGGASNGQTSTGTPTSGAQGQIGQAEIQQLTQVLLANQSTVILNPFAPPQSQYQAAARIVKKVQVRREPQGFPVTITALLKQPLVVPQLPGTVGATAGIGGLPGAPGMGMASGYPGAGPTGYPGGSTMPAPNGYPGVYPGR